jgi:S1-C subfamily serine protease
MALAAALWVSAQGTNLFAQPALNRVERSIRDLIGGAQNPEARQTRGAAESGYLGLTADDRQEDGRGVRVSNVVAGGAAARAGLQVGDLITSIDGRPIGTTDDMAAAMQGRPLGARLAVTVQRDGGERKFGVVLGRRAIAQPRAESAEELPVPHPPQRLGVNTIAVTEDARRKNNLGDTEGAMVISVAPGSPADRAGIPKGAVIKSFGDQAVRTPQELAAAIRAAQAGEIELVYVFEGAQAHKKLLLAAVAGPPTLEQRARPIGDPVGPRPTEPADHDAPADARVAALEARIRELENRLEKLEARLPPEPEGDSADPK